MVPLVVLATLWGLLYVGWDHRGAIMVGILVGFYLAHCTIHPRIDCWWCHGKRKRRSDEGAGKVFHNCFVCRGRGERVRWGAFIWARNRDLYGTREHDNPGKVGKI